jgi:CYTH domain-containing protein
MPLEIERKFLVAHDGWKKSIVRHSTIRDGLIASNNGNKARVRIADDKATIALKSRRMGMVRTEFEYAIPRADAEEILRTMCDGNVLNKVRHFVIYEDATWQVDVYDDILKGIVIAEIELTPPDQVFQIPDWVGAEVTDDPRYRKVNMRAERLANKQF